MKQKLSNKKLQKIVVPIIAVVVVLLTVANVAMNILSSTMDTFLGGGERTVTVSENAKDWHSDYYETPYASYEETREAAYAVATRIVDEGVVLLKNDGALPLAAGSTVVPFGYRCLNPIYGQLTSGGSAKWMVGSEITPEQNLSAHFTVGNAAIDRMRAAGTPTPLHEVPGTLAAEGTSSVLGGDSLLYEYDASVYAGLASDPDATALVFLARAGQEGYDLKSDAYEDGTPHYLALTENEKTMIRAAKSACGKVVLIVESSAAMELDAVMQGECEVDAILWVGHVGERGFSELSAILTGEVNPSGRTVDIFLKDFTADPTYVNNGDYRYTNANAMIYGLGGGEEIQRPFVEYQEGVYMGYRYYETAAELGAIDYGEAVLFPFGYGLSYTEFDQSIVDLVDDGDRITATVRVQNVGDAAGREVVQLYSSAPYTSFDAENRIEKPSVVLATFGKTDLLPVGGEQTLTLSFAKTDMASYCTTHANADGTVGAYVLEAGDYVVSLRKDSHTVLDSRTVQITEPLWLDGAHNLFQDSTDYMQRQSALLTRTDWAGSFPQQERTKEADEKTLALFGIDNAFDWQNDALLGNQPGSAIYAEQAPTQNAHNGLQLISLRGKDYDDPMWDALLDQIDWTNSTGTILSGLCGAAYNTPRVDDIGLVSTVVEDGVSGIKVVGTDNGYDMTKTATFGMMPLLASTWNVTLAKEMGEALGREGLATGVQGLYGPAINLHRSPFCGRVFEYFSEDPLLSGKMAAAEISGAMQMGLTCYLKHFALNDQETNRQYLLSVWADEQTMRELYFRPFEIAVKEATCTISYIADESGTIAEKEIPACTAIMASQCNLGAVPGHTNYALLHDLLRGEWGFRGVVSTDYWFWTATGKAAKNANSLRDASFRASSDVYLCMGMPAITVNDKSSATALTAYRQNIKNLAYAVVNSAAMQGVVAGSTVTYRMSPWQKVLIAADIAVGVLTVAAVVWLIVRATDEKKHPEHYRTK